MKLAFAVKRVVEVQAIRRCDDIVKRGLALLEPREPTRQRIGILLDHALDQLEILNRDRAGSQGMLTVDSAGWAVPFTRTVGRPIGQTGR